ncbi:MAG: 50S ribosomal protein L23 [Nanoarchaeota archaeon]|nr:50S ribosomal protein L23 [Nanoarchaeota archaeon]
MIIKAPLSSEKAIRLMESENKLVFIVDKKATKNLIKTELESMFQVKVKNVNTLIGPDAKKRAYVTFSDETPAIDLATKLELM